MQNRVCPGAACLAAVALAVLFAGLRCDTPLLAGSTEVWVFNQTRDSLTVADQTVGYWSSAWFTLHRGEFQSLAITRDGRVLDTLVVTSLVPEGDPHEYGATVNVHEDTLNHLRIDEYSPWIDAHLTGLGGAR